MALESLSVETVEVGYMANLEPGKENVYRQTLGNQRL